MITSTGTPTGSVDRSKLLDWYRKNRERSAALFALIHDDAFYDRPIPLRHPFAFYEGHIPAFSYLTLNERGLQEESLDPRARAPLRARDRSRDASTKRGITSAPTGPTGAPLRLLPPRATNAFCARLRFARSKIRRFRGWCGLRRPTRSSNTRRCTTKRCSTSFISSMRAVRDSSRSDHHDHAPPPSDPRTVERGIATLGAQPDEIAFGWDNEFGRDASRRCRLRDRDVSGYQRATGCGSSPMAARCRTSGRNATARGCLRLHFEEIPMPQSWPVYVTHKQAEAYARWAGSRLPTEAEYHRAAFGTPQGDERAFPWGSEAAGAADMATLILRASIPSRSTRIPPARALGASPT